MEMSTKVWVCIWSGFMFSDRRNYISLKFVQHMIRKNTGKVKKGDICQFGQKHLSRMHDVLVLLMFS